MNLKLICLSAYVMASIASVESNISFDTKAGEDLKRTDKEFMTNYSIIFSVKTPKGFLLQMKYDKVDIELAIYASMVRIIAQVSGIGSLQNFRTGDPYSKDRYTLTHVWASWGNGKVQCGEGFQIDSNTVLSVEIPVDAEFGSFQYIRYNSVEAGFWTIIQPKMSSVSENQNKDFRKSTLVLQNVNIQSGVMWQQTAVNPGHCAFVCLSDDACLSYTYNSMKKVCRSHREKYQNLNDVTHSPEEWSEYYTYD